MVETTTSTQATDKQTQFGNARHLDPSDCIFVFKDTLSDYEEPLSDEEVSASSQSHCDRFLYGIRGSHLMRYLGIATSSISATHFANIPITLCVRCNYVITRRLDLGWGKVTSLSVLK